VGELTRTVARAAILAALLGTTAACVQRPLGDFGRAEPGVVHDEVMPAIGQTRAQLFSEPVSQFNLSDQEREMHDRVWRFLVSAHAQDWFFDVAVELQRTRLSGPTDQHFRPDRYYRWLRQTDFASSRVRYNAVSDDVRLDLGTLPSTFRAICAVIEIDRQRGVAAREIAGIGEGTRENALARKAENDTYIDWFVRAVTYRYESYSYALDHLLVETPHEEAVEVDGLLSDMAIDVEQARRGDFCAAGSGVVPRGNGALPSRVLMQEKGEGPYLK
jgi:hypothetical protein